MANELNKCSLRKQTVPPLPQDAATGLEPEILRRSDKGAGRGAEAVVAAEQDQEMEGDDTVSVRGVQMDSYGMCCMGTLLFV